MTCWIDLFLFLGLFGSVKFVYVRVRRSLRDTTLNTFTELSINFPLTLVKLPEKKENLTDSPSGDSVVNTHNYIVKVTKTEFLLKRRLRRNPSSQRFLLRCIVGQVRLEGQ